MNEEGLTGTRKSGESSAGPDAGLLHTALPLAKSEPRSFLYFGVCMGRLLSLPATTHQLPLSCTLLGSWSDLLGLYI